MNLTLYYRNADDPLVKRAIRELKREDTSLSQFVIDTLRQKFHGRERRSKKTSVLLNFDGVDGRL